MFRRVVSPNCRAASTTPDIANTEPSGSATFRLRKIRQRTIVALAVLVPASLIGAWIDSWPAISESELHTLFLAISILVTVAVLVCFFRQVGATRHNVVSLVAAIVAWRISFFPLIVLAGCLTSWCNALTTQLSAYDVVYPVFVGTFALLFAGVICIAVIIARGGHKITTVIAIGLGLLASSVSFITSTDVKWTLTSNLTMHSLHPIQSNLPVANPYPAILAASNLNWRQRLLMHIGSLTYESLPTKQAPWAISVKGSLEQQMRTASNYKSETLLRDHYRAFSAAHVTIRRP